MQDKEHTTSETLSGEEQTQDTQGEPEIQESSKNVPSADGDKAGSDVSNLTLDELNSYLGKQYPDKDTALKSLKDTFSYVGKKVQPEAPKAPEIDPNKFVSREEFEKATFFAKHPEYEAHADLLDALSAKHQKPLSQVVELDSFKNVFEKVQIADKSEQSKSVLQTNPRLGKATDNIAQAREAMNKAKQSSSTDPYHSAQLSQAAEDAATKAVLEAYNL